MVKVPTAKLLLLFFPLGLLCADSAVYKLSELRQDPATKRTDTRILFAGDVMFNWGVREMIRKEGTAAVVSELRPFFTREADFCALNLETPIVSDPSVDDTKSYVFTGKESDLIALEELGTDLVFLGNNHSMDHGVGGLNQTSEFLRKYSIHHIGAGNSEKSAYSPIGLRINEEFFQFYSASAIGEWRLFAKDNRPGIAWLNPKKLEDLLDDSQSVGIPILSLHWGVEYSQKPQKSQVQLAHRLIDSGYSVIVGHHPHIPQGVEVYKGGLILYSLGNLLFGSRNSYLEHNLVALVHFENAKPTYAELIPVYGKYQNGEEKPRMLKLEEAEEALARIQALSEDLGTKIEIRHGRGIVKIQKRP